MSRYRAFGIHFGLSFAIFLGLMYLLRFVWYPAFFFDSDGGWQGLRIIIAIDLVLGPVLTLVVYKAGKPGLKLDLALIGLLQTVCLALGLWVVVAERPLAIVYVDGTFYSMSADSYREAGLDVPDLSAYPESGPVWISVDLPEAAADQTNIRRKAIQTQIPLRLFVDRYQPFRADGSFITENIRPSTLETRTAGTRSIETWLGRHGGTLADYRFYPFAARYDYSFLGFDAQTHEPLGLLETAAPPEPLD